MKKTQKNLRLYQDAQLNFCECINENMRKTIKGISVIRKLNVNLPGSFLLTIYKPFIRPHLDYGDVIHDQSNYNGLSEKIESVQ